MPTASSCRNRTQNSTQKARRQAGFSVCGGSRTLPGRLGKIEKRPRRGRFSIFFEISPCELLQKRLEFFHRSFSAPGGPHCPDGHTLPIIISIHEAAATSSSKLRIRINSKLPGTEPDMNRDYGLENSLPKLSEELEKLKSAKTFAVHKNGRFYGRGLQKSTAVHEKGCFYG